MKLGSVGKMHGLSRYRVFGAADPVGGHAGSQLVQQVWPRNEVKDTMMTREWTANLERGHVTRRRVTGGRCTSHEYSICEFVFAWDTGSKEQIAAGQWKKGMRKERKKVSKKGNELSRPIEATHTDRV